MGGMPKVPESTKSSLAYKLHVRAEQRWPELTDIDVTHRAGFAYVTATLTNGQQLRLCRLRYGGSAHIWGFAIYRASHDDYEDNVLPSGSPTGTAEEALDCACGLYLANPAMWRLDPRGFSGENH